MKFQNATTTAASERLNFKGIPGPVCCLLLAAALPIHGQTVTLNPVADTALRSTAANNNFGAAVDLPVGVAIPGSPVNRVLLKFSLDEIPPNATIISATLRLSVVITGTGPADFGLHPVLQDWGEGDKTTVISGAPASDGEATWNARSHPETLWGAPGGQAGTDFVAAPSATASLAGPGSSASFSSGQMLADIEAWLEDPDANFGWFLIAVNEPSSTGKRIGSREHSNPDVRPLLTIEYAVAADDPPKPPNLFDLALIGDAIRFSFEAEANRTYTVEFRDSFSNGGWEALTEIPEQPSAATLHITNMITSVEGYFRVRTP